MMTISQCFLAVASIVTTSGCEGRSGNSNQIVDSGLDGGSLRDGIANTWVSPDGCQYWYIDDGIEGYMSPRLNRDGTPVCRVQETGAAPILAKDGAVIEFEPEPRL